MKEFLNRDSHASSSHEPFLEPSRSVDLGKYSVKTHFPKDRNCEICQRTKNTRAPCRRRIGRVVPENFGDLITADHKVLSEGCESRNNHRYAIVVQDLATQWIQSYPCKTKTSQETQRSFMKFLEPTRKPKVNHTDNSLEFGKACEDLTWNHCTSTPHRSETNGTAERAVRRVNEGTSAVLLQSGLDENWWADSMECFTYLRNIQDLLSDGKTPYERRFEDHPIRGEDKRYFLGESEGSPPQLPQDSLPDAGEASNDFLFHFRKLHIPPSRRTQSQTLLAERRIISCSDEIH